MSVKQTTIKAPVSVSGVGLHTGRAATLTFKPAPDNHGYKFQRIDVENQPVIEADVDNVIDTSRGTTIGKNGVSVNTIEHALAALVGLEIDNVLLEIDGPEVPIMDGSAKSFVEALEKAGKVEQTAVREYFEPKSNITFEDPVKRAEALIVPAEEYRITVMVDYNSPVLGTQHASMYHLGEFKNEISLCRTFCFLHELEYLVTNNLIKGGDLSNAIVVVDRVVSQEELNKLAKLFDKPMVEVKAQGILNNVQLHFQNEPARHKLLDIVGDLALVGMPIKAHVLTARPGHASNVEVARKIKEMIKAEKAKKATPRFNLNAPSVMDINDISRMLPHRYPFLLIDKIIELGDSHVVGVKNVTMNEPFFQGHFPNNPVMPGVLQVEAMAQTGGILALNNVADPENYWTYFMKIDNTRFKQKVIPGDTLVFSLELASPMRRGICHMKGQAWVGDKVVMESEMMAQIVRKQAPVAEENKVHA